MWSVGCIFAEMLSIQDGNTLSSFFLPVYNVYLYLVSLFIKEWTPDTNEDLFSLDKDRFKAREVICVFPRWFSSQVSTHQISFFHFIFVIQGTASPYSGDQLEVIFTVSFFCYRHVSIPWSPLKISTIYLVYYFWDLGVSTTRGLDCRFLLFFFLTICGNNAEVFWLTIISSPR